MAKRTYTYFADPGHGWLRVPLADIVALEMVGAFTLFSYMNERYAYLEHDCDMSQFLRTAERAGWAVTIREKHCNGSSSIRRMGEYRSAWVREPIGIDRLVYVPGLGRNATIAGESASRWILSTGHTIPKRNPFAYVQPVYDMSETEVGAGK